MAEHEQDFRLPDLGEGLTDAELLRWYVAVGDTVALNQVIAEVETAKAAVELPSPCAGRVLALHVAAGSTVEVGTAIITFGVDSIAASELSDADPGSAVPDAAGSEAASSDAPAAPPDPTATTAPAQRVPVLVGYGATSGTGSRRSGRLRPTGPGSNGSAPGRHPGELPPTPARPDSAQTGVPQAISTDTRARPLAKPLVRKLAKDLAVDLTTIHGSGAGGVITREDVLDRASAALPATPPPSPAAPRAGVRPSGREDRIPVRGVRKATATAMVTSAFTAPHVTEFITVDVTATKDLLDRLRASAFADGVRLTMTAFVATAMLQALRRHPGLNSYWDEAAQEIVVKHYVNLGIAAATPRGLLVPNLKDADQLGLIELARALDTLTATARDGRCTPSDLTGGTISLTNVGVFGVDSGTPILNPGEAAILCLGAVRQQPWVHDGALAVRWVTTLSLSFDHRLVDGEQGSRFLADVAALLTAG